jgi:hypothetical protein
MAELKSTTLVLEVARLESERQTSVYGFRITCRGKDIFPLELRNQARQSSANTQFLASVHEDRPLHRTIRQALQSNESALWCSSNGGMTVALFPCSASLSSLFHYSHVFLGLIPNNSCGLRYRIVSAIATASSREYCPCWIRSASTRANCRRTRIALAYVHSTQ